MPSYDSGIIVANPSVTQSGAIVRGSFYLHSVNTNNVGPTGLVGALNTGTNERYACGVVRVDSTTRFQLLHFTSLGTCTVLDEFNYGSNSIPGGNNSLAFMELVLKVGELSAELYFPDADVTWSLSSTDSSITMTNKPCGISTGGGVNELGGGAMGYIRGFVVDQFNNNTFKASLTGSASLAALPFALDIFGAASLSGSATITPVGGYDASTLRLLDYRIAKVTDEGIEDWLAPLNTAGPVDPKFDGNIAVHMRIKNDGPYAVDDPRMRMWVEIPDLSISELAWTFNSSTFTALATNLEAERYTSITTGTDSIEDRVFIQTTEAFSPGADRKDVLYRLNLGVSSHSMDYYNGTSWSNNIWTHTVTETTITRSFPSFGMSGTGLLLANGDLHFFYSGEIDIGGTTYATPNHIKRTAQTTWSTTTDIATTNGQGANKTGSSYPLITAIQSSTGRVWCFWGNDGGFFYYAYSDDDCATWTGHSSLSNAQTGDTQHQAKAFAGGSGKVGLCHGSTQGLYYHFDGTSWKTPIALHTGANTTYPRGQDMHGVMQSTGDAFLVVAKIADDSWDEISGTKGVAVFRVYEYTESSNTSAYLGGGTFNYNPHSNETGSPSADGSHPEVWVTSVISDRYVNFMVSHGKDFEDNYDTLPITVVRYDTTLNTYESRTLWPRLDAPAHQRYMFRSLDGSRAWVGAQNKDHTSGELVQLIGAQTYDNASETPHRRRIGATNPEASVKAVGDVLSVPAYWTGDPYVANGSMASGSEAEFVMVMPARAFKNTNVEHLFYPVTDPYAVTQYQEFKYTSVTSDYIDANSAFPAGVTNTSGVSVVTSGSIISAAGVQYVMAGTNGEYQYYEETYSLSEAANRISVRVWLDDSFDTGSYRFRVQVGGISVIDTPFSQSTYSGYTWPMGDSSAMASTSSPVVRIGIYSAASHIGSTMILDNIQIAFHTEPFADRGMRETIVRDNTPTILTALESAALTGTATLTAVGTSGASSDSTLPATLLALTGYVPQGITSVGGEDSILPATLLSLTGQIPDAFASDFQASTLPATPLSLFGLTPGAETSGDFDCLLPAVTLDLTGQIPDGTLSDFQASTLPATLLALTEQIPVGHATEHKWADLPTGSLDVFEQAPDATSTDLYFSDLPATPLALTGQAPGSTTSGLLWTELPSGSLALNTTSVGGSTSEHVYAQLAPASLALTGQNPGGDTSERHFSELGTDSFGFTGQNPGSTTVENRFSALEAGTLPLTGHKPGSLTSDILFSDMAVGSLPMTGHGPQGDTSEHLYAGIPTDTVALTGYAPGSDSAEHITAFLKSGTIELRGNAFGTRALIPDIVYRDLFMDQTRQYDGYVDTQRSFSAHVDQTLAIPARIDQQLVGYSYVNMGNQRLAYVDMNLDYIAMVKQGADLDVFIDMQHIDALMINQQFELTANIEQQRLLAAYIDQVHTTDTEL